MSDPKYDREHERRFKVGELGVLVGSTSEEIEQGYLWSGSGYAVRVRRTYDRLTDGSIQELTAFFTLKGPRAGSSRYEKEVEIPIPQAHDLISLAPYRVHKTRYAVISEGNAWIVDVFHGENSGLVLAEFEGTEDEVAAIRPPWWCLEEVTSDTRYNNENLAQNPWTQWNEQARGLQ